MTAFESTTAAHVLGRPVHVVDEVLSQTGRAKQLDKHGLLTRGVGEHAQAESFGLRL